MYSFSPAIDSTFLKISPQQAYTSGIIFLPSFVILVNDCFPTFILSTYPFDTSLSTNLVTVEGAIVSVSDILLTDSPSSSSCNNTIRKPCVGHMSILLKDSSATLFTILNNFDIVK